jgi:hypothetical protein
MHNFVVRLDHAAKEELYSDISDEFMGFILIEAIMIILAAGKPGAMNTLDDQERIQEYPEHQFDVSIDYLLEVIEQINVECGVFLPKEEYECNSDIHGRICTKLADAIEIIEAKNDIGETLALRFVFEDPLVAQGFKFVAMHYPDRVAFCIIPASVANMKSDVTLAKLLEDYELNNDPTPWNFLDPVTLSFQNDMFFQRS